MTFSRKHWIYSCVQFAEVREGLFILLCFQILFSSVGADFFVPWGRAHLSKSLSPPGYQLLIYYLLMRGNLYFRDWTLTEITFFTCLLWRAARTWCWGWSKVSRHGGRKPSFVQGKKKTHMHKHTHTQKSWESFFQWGLLAASALQPGCLHQGQNTNAGAKTWSHQARCAQEGDGRVGCAETFLPQLSPACSHPGFHITVVFNVFMLENWGTCNESNVLSSWGWAAAEGAVRIAPVASKEHREQGRYVDERASKNGCWQPKPH